jgi:hypothetical protein
MLIWDSSLVGDVLSSVSVRAYVIDKPTPIRELFWNGLLRPTKVDATVPPT